jgi:hypothetical protein
VFYIDLFRVRLVEGDPTALAINDLLDRHGWKPAASTGTGNFGAVQTVERIYLSEPAAAERAIATLTRAWGHDPNGADGRVFEGLGLLFLRYGDAVDVEALVEKLSKYPGGPGRLLGAARGLREMVGSTVSRSVAEIVVGLYNQRRRTKALAPWRASAT